MGGMEDYYIAQFFCWREIILLNLEIDIETFSSVNLAKAGVYRYAESPDFEVLLFGYSVDGGEVKVGDLVKGEKIPEEVMSALEDEAVTKWAFNAQFERICISRMLGYEAGTYLVPASWKCSMVWSAYMGLSLDVYSNIICLCPLCHRKIHYGMENEKKIMLDSIYAKRSSRLAKSGIRMSQDEFVRFANHTF